MNPDRGTSRSSTGPAQSVLVVEDRREVRELVMRSLAEQGYAITIATTGPDAVEAALAGQPDLVILDLGLPGMDGIDVIRTLRAQRFPAPILVLTARGGVDDRVQGLDAGADDYLPKPFDLEELSARSRALLRRGRGGQRLTVVDLTCDTVAREVRRDGETILLTQREYSLLEFLMRNAGVPVTRDTLAREVWKTEFDPEHNVIDVYVSYLRQKLVAGGRPQLLHTVRGVGYVLREPLPRQAGSSRSGIRSAKGR